MTTSTYGRKTVFDNPMSRRELLPEMLAVLNRKKRRMAQYVDPFSSYNLVKKPLDVNEKQGAQSNGFWRGTEQRDPAV